MHYFLSMNESMNQLYMFLYVQNHIFAQSTYESDVMGNGGRWG